MDSALGSAKLRWAQEVDKNDLAENMDSARCVYDVIDVATICGLVHVVRGDYGLRITKTYSSDGDRAGRTIGSISTASSSKEAAAHSIWKRQHRRSVTDVRWLSVFFSFSCFSLSRSLATHKGSVTIQCTLWFFIVIMQQ